MPQIRVLGIERGEKGPFVRLKYFPGTGRDTHGPYFVIVVTRKI